MPTFIARPVSLFRQPPRGATASLALGLALGVATLAAARPAYAADAPTARGVVGNNAPVNINNPQDKATLADRIDQALERAKAKQTQSTQPSRQRANRTPPSIPAVQVHVPPERPRAAPSTTPVVRAPQPASPTVLDPQASRRDIQARAAALAASAAAAGAAAQMPAGASTPAPSQPLANAGAVRWDYRSGDLGPAQWANLHPTFAACNRGQEQSPVQANPGDLTTALGDPILASSTWFGGTVYNTGNGMALDVEGVATLALRGQVWRVLQLQFHHPAQERMHRQTYPMDAELRLIGQDGRQAVVSVPMQRGTNHPFLARIWPYLPLDTTDQIRLPQAVLTLPELLPADRRSYQYMGSLTQPPCTEGVLRIVMKNPVSVGADQLRLLQRLTPPNARPVQPLNGRAVLEVGARRE